METTFNIMSTASEITFPPMSFCLFYIFLLKRMRYFINNDVVLYFVKERLTLPEIYEFKQINDNEIKKRFHFPHIQHFFDLWTREKEKNDPLSCFLQEFSVIAVYEGYSIVHLSGKPNPGLGQIFNACRLRCIILFKTGAAAQLLSRSQCFLSGAAKTATSSRLCSRTFGRKKRMTWRSPKGWKHRISELFFC